MSRSLATALLLPALAWLAGVSFPATVQAQINRCIGADGVAIYTDRRCSDLGAVERPQREQAAATRHAYRGCSRNLRDLVREITIAVDSRDVNRLAGVYNFTGMSHRGGYGVMGRLDAIVQQPLVDIVALRPATPVAATLDGGLPAMPAEVASAAAGRRPPVALRLEQTAGNSASPRRTVFNLRRHMDCWWVTL